MSDFINTTFPRKDEKKRLHVDSRLDEKSKQSEGECIKELIEERQETKSPSYCTKDQKLPSDVNVPGLTSELNPDSENLVQTISNKMLLPNALMKYSSSPRTTQNIHESKYRKHEKVEKLEDRESQQLSIRGDENNTFRLFIPAIAEKEIGKKRGFCCCRNRARRKNSLDVKQMKTFGLWKWFLHRMLLAVQVVNVLKNVQKEIEIYGAKGESQTTALQRGKSTLLKDEEDQYKCILLPESKFTLFWMLQIMLLLVWMAIYIPYRIAFLDTVSLEIFIMECCVDGIFLTDVIINFFTAYYDDKDNLVLDKKIIAKHYLKTWFTIDLLSSLPFQIFDSSINNHNKLIKLLRLPRIYRIIKVIKLTKMVDLMKPSSIYEKMLMFIIKLHSGFIRLSKVMIIMEFFMHFYSCLWYYIAKFEGFQPDCWVVYHGILDASNTRKYLMSFYWVLQTVTSVGYGDMNIGNETERILAIILMIFGVGFYSYMIGNLSSIFSTLDTGQMKLNKKLLALNEFAAKLKMPTQLYFKIRRILERNAASSNFNLLDQETLLNELPAALKSEVTQHTHQKILNSFSFFKGKPPQFVADILPEFQHISLGKDEVIYRKGEWVEDTYFLLKGRVAFITKDGYIFRNYVNGSYFGEVEHFQELPSRLHSVLTMEETELLAVKTTELDNILLKYPDIKTELTTIAKQRFHKNKDALLVAQRVGFKIDNDRLQLLNQGTQDGVYKDFYQNIKRRSLDLQTDSDLNNDGSSLTDSQNSSHENVSSNHDNEIFLINKRSSINKRTPSHKVVSPKTRLSSTSKRVLRTQSSPSHQDSFSPLRIDKNRIKYYKEDKTNSEPDNHFHIKKRDSNIICHTDEGKYFDEVKSYQEHYLETELDIGEENKVSEKETKKGRLYDFEEVVHRKPYFHSTFTAMANTQKILDLLPPQNFPSVDSNSCLSPIEEDKESAECSPDGLKTYLNLKNINKNSYDKASRNSYSINYDDNTNNTINFLIKKQNLRTRQEKFGYISPKKINSEINLFTRKSRISSPTSSRKKSSRKIVLSNENIKPDERIYQIQSSKEQSNKIKRLKRKSFAYFKTGEKTQKLLHEAATKCQLDALLKTNQGILRQLSINNQRRAAKTATPSNSMHYSGLKWCK